MCNPIAAIATIAQGGAGVPAAVATLGQFASIASGGLGVASAITGANAQADAYEANAAAANQAKVDTDRQLNLQQAQLDEKAAQEKIAQNLQTQQIASTATTAAGESGGFLNNDAVVQDIVRQGVEANTMTTQNLERNVAQIGEQRLGAISTAQSRVNAVAKPSRMATGLQIGTSVLGAASDYSKFA
tara:strand:+ start:783 stop:1343 length:561 start_codon:yes stop_codon:yes gene_type:complete